MKRIYRLIRSPAVILGVLAAVIYNNWLLGPILNHRLFQLDGSISEYSAASQPFSWLFRGLDVLAGMTLIMISSLFWNHLKSRSYGRPLAISVAVLGFANILDALWTLPCSETLSKQCVVPISLSPHHFQMPLHAYSSMLIGICYLVVPIIGLAYSQRHRLRGLYLISVLAILEAVYSLISALVHYHSVRSATVVTSGFGQEVQMVIVGLWLAVASWSVFYELPNRNKRAGDDDSQ